MDDLRVHRGLTIPASELTEQASRSSGPGGQHVNKASTRVTLRWSVSHSAILSERQRGRLQARLAARLTRDGELVVHAGRARSRTRNRDRARERLAEIVREALAATRPRVATAPTAGSRERRISSKRQRSQLKRQRHPPSRDD